MGRTFYKSEAAITMVSAYFAPRMRCYAGFSRVQSRRGLGL
jgi:hypothetical protein